MSELVSSVIADVARRIESVCLSADHAYQCAMILIEAVTGLSRAALLAREHLSLTDDERKRLHDFIHRLVVEHEPLAYIVGFVPFLGLTILTESPILIPRPETEWWVATLCDNWRSKKDDAIRILDLCTGSGCISLALAHYFSHSMVVAVDNSPDALALVERNAEKNNIKNVTFVLSDLFEKVSDYRPFDIITANPPYVSESEFAELDPSVRLWEDKYALVAQDEGFALVDRIIREAPPFVRKNVNSLPQLWVELGARHGKRALAVCDEVGWRLPTVLEDLTGRDRVITALL
ncbi:MAG: peptide chain release factor N(5)-glutamine methyltransferase [Candidatus Babeliaceae bacterium]|nr:peptide chain release factor N(5)-glutamine methyltransferase [Candidatus Babeliaceae bacterium]